MNRMIYVRAAAGLTVSLVAATQFSYPSKKLQSGQCFKSIFNWKPIAEAQAGDTYMSDGALVYPRVREAPKIVESAKIRGKRLVAYHAVNDFVKDGMTVGIGSGSTCYLVVEEIGRKMRSSELHDIKVVPCSVDVKKHCISVGVPVSALSFATGQIDVCIDGADEVDATMALIKGGSGSLLREKMMENSSAQVVIVVDDTKLVHGLGPGHPVPVEVVCWDYERTIRQVEELLPGSRGVLRRGQIDSLVGDGPYPAITDNGNFIVDFYFKQPIEDIAAASAALDGLSGVVEHGLFSGQATTILVATTNDRVHPLRVIGHYPVAPEKAEQPWWNSMKPAQPYLRKSIDNRSPVDYQYPLNEPTLPAALSSHMHSLDTRMLSRSHVHEHGESASYEELGITGKK